MEKNDFFRIKKKQMEIKGEDTWRSKFPDIKNEVSVLMLARKLVLHMGKT